jgi:hypothetical protein
MRLLKTNPTSLRYIIDKTIGNILSNIDMYFRQYYLINLSNM